MLANNFRLAWRNVRKSPAQTTISLLSLVLGLTFFFLISFWIKDELSYDTGFADPHQLGRVETNLILSDGTSSSIPAVRCVRVIVSKVYRAGWENNAVSEGFQFVWFVWGGVACVRSAQVLTSVFVKCAA